MIELPTNMDCEGKYNVINFVHEWQVIALFALRFQPANGDGNDSWYVLFLMPGCLMQN